MDHSFFEHFCSPIILHSQKLWHINALHIFYFSGCCHMQEWPGHITLRNGTKRFCWSSDVIKSLVSLQNTGRSSKLLPRGLSTEPLCQDLPLGQNRGWSHLENGVKSGFLCLTTIRENTVVVAFFLKLKLAKLQGSKNQIESMPLLRVNNPSSSTWWTWKMAKTTAFRT